MPNDNGFVDELERIQNERKELEIKEQDIRNKIIALAKERSTDILFGNRKKCSIKEYIKVIYPEDKAGFTELIKKKGLYESYASISYPKLSSAIAKGIVDNEITSQTKQEKAFRLSLKDI